MESQMRCRIDGSALREAASWVARGVPDKPTLPILSGMRLTANEHELALAAFDHDLCSEARLDASVESPGDVLVPGRVFAEICRSLPGDVVSLSTEQSRLRLTCSDIRFALLTLALEEYPAFPEHPPTAGMVEGALFARAATSVAVAASRDETLPVLTGLKVEVDGDRVILTATDRFRAAIRSIH